jgi:hypothetical protein
MEDIASLVDEEPKQIESTQLQGTIIAPYLEQDIPAGKNVLFCSTLQLAWNALEDEVIGEKILLEGEPSVVKALGKRLATRKDLSEDCYVAMAERLSEEFLQRLNRALKEKFGDQAPPEVKEAIPPGAPRFLAYAYLFKNLEFLVPFELIPDELSFYSGDNALEGRAIAFGMEEYKDEGRQQEMARQVRAIQYLNGDQFLIEMESKSKDDRILLAKINPRETLLKTVEAVEQTARGGCSTQPHLKEGETLRIPALNFNVKHTFAELSGKRFVNKGKEDWAIDRAIQWTRFRLNQKGALLKSEARIYAQACEPGPSPNYVPPRRFVFDKPFLICLKQKGARYPYFAMWVGNTELMVKAK